MDLTKDIKTPIGLIIVIAVLAGFSIASASAGYLLYQKLSDLERRVLDEERAMSVLDELEKTAEMESDLQEIEQQEDVLVLSAIEWTAREKIPDLGLVLKELPDTQSQYYKVGLVKSGQYAGGKVIIASVPEEGMGTYLAFYRLIRHEGTLYLLSRYSHEINTGVDRVDLSKFTIDSAYTIPELEIPLKIEAQDGMFLIDRTGPNQFFSSSGLSKVFTHPLWGDVYTDSDQNTEAKFFDDSLDPEKPVYGGNAFYFRAADSTVRRYILDIDALLYNVNRVPAIRWNDGTENGSSYTYTDVGGCGSRNFVSVMTPEKVSVERDLVVAGTIGKGDPVYQFKGVNHPFLKEFYEKRYLPIVPETPIQYNDFINQHPLFFWTDPFDRLIKFESNDFIPQVECAKPVIYLYPKQTERVSVKISPKGGLRYAEPAYEGGWEVVARPDGRLETETGVEYPYLFWEGRGGIYQTPKKGFVVEKENVHTFLQEKLARLGLNDREISDFTEYWEPYMQDAPYYFITFLTGRMVDELAPLEVSPKPNTVIRILMDFEPLDEPKEVEGYEIKTPIRRGFTVVEWGGVRRP